MHDQVEMGWTWEWEFLISQLKLQALLQKLVFCGGWKVMVTNVIFTRALISRQVDH